MPISTPKVFAQNFFQNFRELDVVARAFSKPKVLAGALSLTPPPLLSQILCRLINETLAEKLRAGDFDFLESQSVSIHIQDIKLYFGIRKKGNRIEVEYPLRPDFQVDATLTLGIAEGIALILQQTDPDTLFFHRRLKIAGSTEVAHQLKNTLDTIDPSKIPGWLQQLLIRYQEIHQLA